MKKTIVIVAGLVALITITLSFTTTFDPPKFKNLKVLPKNISEHAMDSIMNNYSVALGVKCGFCHVENKKTNTWDMASDANPHKLITRKMMLMTNSINKTFFKPEGGNKNQQLIQTVTCYTCHRGSPHPSSEQHSDEEK